MCSRIQVIPWEVWAYKTYNIHFSKVMLLSLSHQFYGITGTERVKLNIKTKCTPKRKIHTNFVLKETVFIKKLYAELFYSLWRWLLPFPQHKTTAKSVRKILAMLGNGAFLVIGDEMKWYTHCWNFWKQRQDNLFFANILFTCIGTKTCPRDLLPRLKYWVITGPFQLSRECSI